LPKCNAPPNPSSNSLIEATAGLTYGFHAISSASLRTTAWGYSPCYDIGHLDLLGVAGKRCTIVVEQHEQRPFRRKIREAQQGYEIGIEGTIERSTTDPPRDANWQHLQTKTTVCKPFRLPLLGDEVSVNHKVPQSRQKACARQHKQRSGRGLSFQSHG
jgi:hypothetical protein